MPKRPLAWRPRLTVAARQAQKELLRAVCSQTMRSPCYVSILLPRLPSVGAVLESVPRQSPRAVPQPP